MKRILLLVLIVLLLAGYEAKNNLNVTEPEPALQEASVETTVETQTASDLQSHDTNDEETPTSDIDLSKRVKELGIDIPQGYIETVEEHSKLIIPEALEYLAMESAETAGNLTPTIEIMEHGRFYIIHLKANVWSYNQLNEYHVFDDGVYTGAVEFDAPATLVGEGFREYKDRVWLIVDVYAGHGMGGPSFYRNKQIWFEISHPDLIAAWSFTSRLHGAWIYPEPETEYEAKVVNAEAEQYPDGGERFIVTIEWSEKLALGIDWNSDTKEIDLFSERGVVRYSYAYDYSNFYKSSDGVQIGSYIFSGNETSDISGISNDIYNEQTTYYGRDKYNFLLSYKDKMIEMSKTGSEEQKKWLHDFLDSFEEAEAINKLYQWNKTFK